MPIYEYRCRDCQQVFEEWCKQVESADITHSCPVCNGDGQRIMSQTSFALKGEGWYVTEYGKNSAKVDASAQPAAESTSKDTAQAPSAESGAASSASASTAEATATKSSSSGSASSAA